MKWIILYDSVSLNNGVRNKQNKHDSSSCTKYKSKSRKDGKTHL
jgi:hypothetical protein